MFLIETEKTKYEPNNLKVMLIIMLRYCFVIFFEVVIRIRTLQFYFLNSMHRMNSMKLTPFLNHIA